MILMACAVSSSTQRSCQYIEFEPDDQLFISTEAIVAQEEEIYQLNGNILHLGKEVITDHGFCWSDTGLATLDGAAVHLGGKNAVGTFSAEVSGLPRKTMYFVRSFAITAEGVVYGNERYFRTRPRTVDPVVKDIDGNSYNVVIIGQQAWMVENLRTTRYADGTPIPLVESDSAWQSLSVADKAYSWYDNDPAKAHYGAYYTWAAAMNGEEGSEENPSGIQGVCPEEWHIPSDAEWNQLHIFLGMNPNEADNFGFIGTRQRIGTKMKGIGNPLWEEDLSNWYLNQSGFTALPVGQRNDSGLFMNLGKYTYFWSSTPYDETNVWYRYLQRGHAAVLRVYTPGDIGFSVRCVIDL